MTVTAQATQLSNTTVQLTWTTDLPYPNSGGFGVHEEINAPSTDILQGLLFNGTLEFLNDISALTVGDVVTYRIVDNDNATEAQLVLTVADLDEPYTYGQVSFLETTARYTSVAAVKQRLAIEPTDVARDAEILSAIIASELALDVFMHRSFPDTGTNPKIPGIPDGISQAALQTAIATWKEADAPTGSAGSDSFMGAISVSETTRTMIQQSAVLIGFRVGWGIG